MCQLYPFRPISVFVWCRLFPLTRTNVCLARAKLLYSFQKNLHPNLQTPINQFNYFQVDQFLLLFSVCPLECKTFIQYQQMPLLSYFLLSRWYSNHPSPLVFNLTPIQFSYSRKSPCHLRLTQCANLVQLLTWSPKLKILFSRLSIRSSITEPHYFLSVFEHLFLFCLIIILTMD